jgi:hypothetical protein
MIFLFFLLPLLSGIASAQVCAGYTNITVDSNGDGWAVVGVGYQYPGIELTQGYTDVDVTECLNRCGKNSLFKITTLVKQFIIEKSMSLSYKQTKPISKIHASV